MTRGPKMTTEATKAPASTSKLSITFVNRRVLVFIRITVTATSQATQR